MGTEILFLRAIYYQVFNKKDTQFSRLGVEIRIYIPTYLCIQDHSGDFNPINLQK
jgi:hypothetical protein